jgi:hypothetical protein
MKTTLRLEEAGMLLLSIYLYYTSLHYSGWLFWALFLLPDLSMLGYLANTRMGAFVYNLFHHKGVAVLIYIAGLWSRSEPLQLAGLVLFGHSSFDRMMGYGLKYGDAFTSTHLGKIGKARMEPERQ